MNNLNEMSMRIEKNRTLDILGTIFRNLGILGMFVPRWRRAPVKGNRALI